MTRNVQGMFRSGWWVAVAAVMLTVATVILLVRPRPASRVGDGRTVASYGFSLDDCRVPRERIVAANMARDGIASIDHPAFLTVDELAQLDGSRRGKLLVPDDRVVGVVSGDDARAYPIRLLRWHEVVNDVVDGLPIAVTYHPLTDAVVVLNRLTPRGTVELGVSGLLYSSTQLLYDRRTDGPSSLWSPLLAQAIAGPRAGARLPIRPAVVTTWQTWRRRHPDTTVLAPVPAAESLYRRDPYQADLVSDVLRFPVDPLPPRQLGLGLKDRVVAVGEGDDTVVVAAGSEPRRITVAGREVEVRVTTTPALAEARVADTHEPVPLRFACWFAWYTTHPDAVPTR